MEAETGEQARGVKREKIYGIILKSFTRIRYHRENIYKRMKEQNKNTKVKYNIFG